MRVSVERLLVAAVLALSLVMLLLQAFVLRPRLVPGGAGFMVSGDTVMGPFAVPRPIEVIRPPDLAHVLGQPVEVLGVVNGGAAARAGLRDGDQLRAFGTPAARIGLDAGLPGNAADALRVWRATQHLPPSAALELEISRAGQTRSVVTAQPPVWAEDAALAGPWLRQHLAPLAQMSAFLAGAAALVVLGTRGTTATLATLGLIATATANSGPLHGAHTAVPLLGPLVLLVSWLMTPLSFPIIGLAVLFFPHRAAILNRHRWIVPAVLAASVPMLIISSTTAAFLLGADAALPLLSWFALRGWTFEASFAVALGVNVLLIIEGIARYRTNFDANERRRIEIVVFTVIPAVFAYALKTGIPLVLGRLGRPVELWWPVEAVLLTIFLLPAFGLPYAVAVKHVFSPRTVLRRSLQYAFARRTLTALVALPIIALVASLVQQRDQSLSMIIMGRPLFYIVVLALLALGLKYRLTAQRWLDRQFFRAEYDAREILVSLAGRVPYEADPRDLLAMVVTQIDSALHPEGIAVFASDAPTGSSPNGLFTPVSSIRVDASPLPADSGVITLLRWSDKPLEVFLDDEQSPVARVPEADRSWLARMNAALLVPIFAGGSDPRPFVGLIALGHKRSEEPYTPEDRELLRGIAVQMGVALDLSRLRRQAGVASPAPAAATPTMTPTAVAAGTARASGITVGVVVDGKYRVDAVVGEGGMGAVFRAWDLRLERAVAIKVVRADLLSDPDSRARFRRESQIVARLQHPSIVTVFDYGTLADGSAFLVMEFVPGEDLRSLLRREGKLPAPRAADLLGGICGGVDAAHKSGILHRDLKPENILLPESGIGPKVVDFGVAKLTTTTTTTGGGTLTAAGTVVGTPAYMAPEQLRGDAVDGRADVYSLGVMTYEMLTARLPFGSGSFVDIAMKQARGRVDMAGLPTAVAGAIRRAIAYDRAERQESPSVFAQEVREKITKAE
ncbi:MAG TPA: protein kinase [Vicinamibacterales bacterium]|nr:protein kinase [Vicinamibacterales bacterium]